MALVFNDRVKETSVTTGTGTLTLDGAVQGFETFSSAIGNSNTTYYAIELPGTTEFEVGRGTVSAGQLARTQVISSSNSDSPVDFSAGTKIVFCTLPASKAVIKDASGNIPIDANKTIEFGDSGETISGDGTAITVASSEDITLDAASEINLDAGSDSIRIKDDGTEYGRIHRISGGGLIIKSQESDKDIQFQGVDGGSGITPMMIDMSEKGRVGIGTTTPLAPLHIDDSGGAFVRLTRTGFSGYLQLATAGGTGSLSVDGANTLNLRTNDTNHLSINGSGNVTVETGTFTADQGVIVDNITIDGTEIDLSSGDLTLDVAGDIILNADGGDWIFRDGSTEILKIFNASSDVSIKAQVQDKDLKFLGNDGGSGITALTLDMSEAGAATFNDKIILGANKVIEFGDSGETISGDGTDLTIASSNDATIDVAGQINLDASDIGRIHLMHDGTTYAHILRSGQNLEIKSSISDGDFEVHGNDGGVSINAFKLDMSEAGAATFNDKVILGANKVIEFGDSGETISGDGTDMTVSSSGILNLNSSASTGAAIKLTPSAGGVLIDSFSLIVLDADNADNGIQYKDGATEMLRIHNSSSDVILHTKVQDKDLIFKGNDGGSDITALTLDMSAAGAATFNDEIILGGNKKIKFGTADENINGDGANVLNINSGGAINIAGNSANITSASTNIANFSSGGSKLFVMTNSSQSVILETDVSDKDLIFKGNDGGSVITALTLDMSEAGAAAFNSTITADSGKDVILGKNQGTNFTNSLLVGHNTTGTLNSAQNNTGVGISALDALTTGDSNTAIGTSAGSAINTGALNVFIGTSAGAGATDMQGCIAIGAAALGSADPGNNNIAIGESAGANITGVRNLCIGENAGDNITSGSGNVIIGSAVDAGSATGNRQLIIAGNDGSTTTTFITGDSSGNITIPGTVTANGEVLTAGVSAGFAVAMAIAL